MKRYLLRPSALFIAEERMIIDTDKRLIRKYNETACRIIEMVCHSAMSLVEIESAITGGPDSPEVETQDILAFLLYLENSQVLDITESS